MSHMDVPERFPGLIPKCDQIIDQDIGVLLMTLRNHYRVVVVLVSLLFSMMSSTVRADDYLKMIEGEAEDLTLDKSGQIVNQEQPAELSADDITRTDWKWEGDLQHNEIPPGLAQDEFATLLKQHYYGTFVFYRKLSSVDQNTVYYHYSQTSEADSRADLDSIRQDILSHLKQ